MQKYKLLISLLLLGYGGYILYQRLSIDFLPVAAVVTRSSKEFYKTSADRPGKYAYTFEYTYSYRDKNYVSDRYNYGGRNTSEAVCNYKTGDTLTAYVNPEDPSYSVINRNVSGFIYALTGIGLLMLSQTIITYLIDKSKTGEPALLKKADRVISPIIGMTVLFGGIGYFIYVLIVAATQQCI